MGKKLLKRTKKKMLTSNLFRIGKEKLGATKREKKKKKKKGKRSSSEWKPLLGYHCHMF